MSWTPGRLLSGGRLGARTHRPTRPRKSARSDRGLARRPVGALRSFPITTVKTSRSQAREAGQPCRQAQGTNRRLVINNVAVVLAASRQEQEQVIQSVIESRSRS